jgi:hypothetical protein
MECTGADNCVKWGNEENITGKFHLKSPNLGKSVSFLNSIIISGLFNLYITMDTNDLTTWEYQTNSLAFINRSSNFNDSVCSSRTNLQINSMLCKLEHQIV